MAVKADHVADVGLPYPPDAGRGIVPVVLQAVGGRPRPDQGLHLGVICLGDEFEGHLFGHHPPQGVVFGDDEGQLPVFDPVLHQQLGDVVSRTSDVVIAAPLAAVDLEELVLAVPAVVLDVKVGEAGVMQLLQQLFDLQGKGLVVLGDDDGVVADAVGGVLLQQHMAQAHQLHLAAAVGVVGHHPHVGVVSGDELLDHHMVGVAGGVHQVQSMEQLLPGLTDEDLLHPLEFVLPVGHAVGRLGHIGGAEGQGEVVAHGAVVDKGGRVVDAVLVAQLVEVLLVDEAVQQGAVDVGGHHVSGKLVLQVGAQLHIAVPAAQDDDGLVGELQGHLLYIGEEDGGVLIVGAGAVVDDGAEGTGEGVELAEGHALHPIGLVKGTGHTVNIDIAAEEQRLKRHRSGHSKHLFLEIAGRITGTGGHSPGRTWGPGRRRPHLRRSTSDR